MHCLGVFSERRAAQLKKIGDDHALASRMQGKGQVARWTIPINVRDPIQSDVIAASEEILEFVP
jgi:hypothetical protein